MAFLCEIGIHKWDGCKCTKCSKRRDKAHDWSKDCEECAKCYTTRKDAHKWEGCVCDQCKKKRDEGHSWNRCVCSKCGKVRHRWEKLGLGTHCLGCEARNFPDFEEYMIMEYGHLMPKVESNWTRMKNLRAEMDFAHPNPFGFHQTPTKPVPPEYVPSFTDFMLNAGESMRQEYRTRYNTEREKFMNDKSG